MFDRLSGLLGGLLSGDAGAAREAPSEELSVALLLLELARSDFEVAEVERARIGDILARRYRLAPDAVQDLMRQAAAQTEQAVSLFDYVKVLNAGLDAAGKRALMEMLWEVAYADGRIDKYEEHLLRKLADLLYVPERDYIGAKLSVAEREPKTS